MVRRLLLLAGTREARELAGHLAGRDDWHVTASLAGATEMPKPLPVTTRIGGFGGRAGIGEFLRGEHISAAIDATHPFATAISDNAAKAAAAARIPLLRLVRPAWVPEAGESWIECCDAAAAAAKLPAGARVFLTTGRGGAEPFFRRSDIWLLVRTLKREGLRKEGRTFLHGGPMSAAAELDLIEKYGITHLVAKNSGGPARGKLQAAAKAGIAVLMIRRPEPKSAAETVGTVSEALAWLDALPVFSRQERPARRDR